MMSSRILTALAGLAISVVVSVAIYLYTGSLLVFLFVPFVPFLFRGFVGEDERATQPELRECPQCSYRTTDPEHEYCPRDGARLEHPRDSPGNRADRL